MDETGAGTVTVPNFSGTAWPADAYLSATQRSIDFGQGDWEDAQKKIERFRARRPCL